MFDTFTKKCTRNYTAAYTNHCYGTSPNWKDDFWGDHYADLLKIKDYYDPDNFSTCFHCVGSDKTYKDDETTDSSAAVTENFSNIFLLIIPLLMSMCLTI